MLIQLRLDRDSTSVLQFNEERPNDAVHMSIQENIILTMSSLCSNLIRNVRLTYREKLHHGYLKAQKLYVKLADT